MLKDSSFSTEEAAAESGRQETRTAILDAAERLLIYYGFQKMTMQDLADEAKIGVGTTYLHFKGKADVAVAVIERANQRYLEQFREIAVGGDSARKRLRQVLLARIMYRYDAARQTRHSMEDLIQTMRTHCQSKGMVWLQAENEVFYRLVQEGIEQGVFVLPGTRTAMEITQCLLLATKGLMPGFLTPSDYDDPTEFEKKAECLIDFLLSALNSSESV
ncbi:MAG: TetR/AcrR family transcriptional regulator [Armatimonadota bacterium]